MGSEEENACRRRAGGLVGRIEDFDFYACGLGSPWRTYV
jgi:hypothetical protein